MSLFPHPPHTSSRRTGRGGAGNLQYDSVALEPDLGPEKHLFPKTHFKSHGRKPRRTGACNRQLGWTCDAGPWGAYSAMSSIEAHQYMPTSPQSESGSSRQHAEKSFEVRTTEKWSTPLQQSKSKDLAAGVATADKWRLKLLRSVAGEADNTRGNRPVEIGLAEEWRSRVVRSLTREFRDGDHHKPNRQKYGMDSGKVWFRKEERGNS